MAMTENVPSAYSFYVYAWLKPDGVPFYVGKGCGSRDLIEKTHNEIFMRTLRKIRDSGDEPRIVRWHDQIAERDAFRLEEAYIKLFGRKDTRTGVLTNLTDGGEGSTGYRHSSDALEKISATHKGKFVSDEIRAKIGAKSVGRKTFLGRTHSADARAKISVARRGTLADGAAREKMSLAQKERFSDPNERLAQGDRQRARFADQAERDKVSESMRRPDVREKLSASARHRASDPVWQARMRELNSTPEARAKNASAQLAAPPRSGSRFKGITQSGKKWRAKIVVSGKAICLGTFESDEDAARAYDAEARKISAKAWLNFPAD